MSTRLTSRLASRLSSRVIRRLVAAVLLVVVVPGHVALADDGFGGAGGGIDAGSFVAAEGVSLADVDVFTGEVRHDVRDTSHAEAAEIEAAASDATREVEASALAAAAAAAAAAKVSGCPDRAPAGTLRAGSATIGVRELCERSVAAASSETSAKVIVFAFANLGTPYSQPRRQTPGWFDCSSYVAAGMKAAGRDVSVGGLMPSTHTMMPHPGYASVGWLRDVTGEVRPGDLLFWGPPAHTGHVAIQLADGFMIHTASTGDVAHVTATRPPHKVRRITG
jgi:cell wall-associated NlpC family hydrolase